MVPSSTASWCVPLFTAITGTPQAIASIVTRPSGPRGLRLSSTSAERIRAGMADWVTWPVKVTRSVTPSWPASWLSA